MTVFVSFQGSHDLSDASRLSANEVEELLKSATVHRQANHRSLYPGGGKPSFNSDPKEAEPRHRQGHHGNSMTGFPSRGSYMGLTSLYGHEDRTQGDRVSHSNLSDRVSHGNHGDRVSQRNFGNRVSHGNHGDRSSHGSYDDVYRSSYHLPNPPDNWPGGPHRISRGTANGGPLPRAQHQEPLSPRQPQLCYTPSSYIPLSDYVSVDEEELFCFSPDGSTATATYRSPAYPRRAPSPLYADDGPYGGPAYPGRSHSPLYADNTPYSGPAYPCRAPSPIYADDAPYTILSSVDTSEPITAVFMGFQLTQDDGGPAADCGASLKAELVVINGDSDDETGDAKTQGGSNGWGPGEALGGGARWAERQAAPGTRKRKKQKACCSVC